MDLNKGRNVRPELREVWVLDAKKGNGVRTEDALISVGRCRSLAPAGNLGLQWTALLYDRFSTPRCRRVFESECWCRTVRVWPEGHGGEDFI